MDFKNKDEVMEKHRWFWGLIYDYVNENWGTFSWNDDIIVIKQKVSLSHVPDDECEILENNSFCYLCAYTSRCSQHSCSQCLVLPYNQDGCFLEFDQLEECEFGGSLENKTIVLSLINKIRYKKQIEGK